MERRTFPRSARCLRRLAAAAATSEKPSDKQRPAERRCHPSPWRQRLPGVLSWFISRSHEVHRRALDEVPRAASLGNESELLGPIGSGCKPTGRKIQRSTYKYMQKVCKPVVHHSLKAGGPHDASHVTCHMAHVTCHVSRVTCHMSD